MPSSAATESKSTNNGLALVGKLLLRAFDPAARDGEAENAGGKAVLVCRRNGIPLPRLAEHLAEQFKVLPAPRPAPAPERREPEAVHVLMPFGKHRGRTLGWIARNDAGYLRWMSEELNNFYLAGCAEQVLHFYTGGGR